MNRFLTWPSQAPGFAVAGAFAPLPASAADVTLNALFMNQAAYSDNDVRAMTADFEKANPGIKVNLEFVPYEALHDKIVAAQGAGASGYDVVLFDVIWPAEFATHGFLKDVTDRIDSRPERAGLRRRLDHRDLRQQALGHALDPGYQVPLLQQGHAAEGGHRQSAQDLGRAVRRCQDHQGQGHRQIPHRLELGAGRSADLRLHDPGRCL